MDPYPGGRCTISGAEAHVYTALTAQLELCPFGFVAPLALRSRLRQHGCGSFTRLPSAYTSFRVAELGNALG
jgi:hypothetical protein